MRDELDVDITEWLPSAFSRFQPKRSEKVAYTSASTAICDRWCADL